jgi:7-carboxy-7-deazaguanine synthase
MSNSHLNVAEHFYNIQGEGMSVGAPAVFLRLAGCNFRCSYCDSLEVWKRGQSYSFEELDQTFESSGYYSKLRRGAHLIVTGGNPLLQQVALNNWFTYLVKQERSPERFYIEVETQGDVIPDASFVGWIRQWNVSPKLANSGISCEKAIKFEVLSWYRTKHCCFKFPVTEFNELREIGRIIELARIPRSRVYLMPICSSTDEFNLKFPLVASMARNSGFKVGLRLQVMFWDKTTGV